MHLRPLFHHFQVHDSISSPRASHFFPVTAEGPRPGQFHPCQQPRDAGEGQLVSLFLRKRRQEHLVTGQCYMLRQLWAQRQLTGHPGTVPWWGMGEGEEV